MNLENQVTSLELSKKLKELGVKQESLFTYNQIFDSPDTSFKEEWKLIYGKFNKVKTVSAFTVAELGDILKQVKNLRYYYNPIWGNDSYWIICELGRNENTDYEYSKSEADARAKMLIYLIENKLIDINKLNE